MTFLKPSALWNMFFEFVTYYYVMRKLITILKTEKCVLAITIFLVVWCWLWILKVECGYRLSTISQLKRRRNLHYLMQVYYRTFNCQMIYGIIIWVNVSQAWIWIFTTSMWRYYYNARNNGQLIIPFYRLPKSHLYWISFAQKYVLFNSWIHQDHIL